MKYVTMLETSEKTLRYSVNRNQVLLAFEGDTPGFLIGKQTYNYTEIMEILDTTAWSDGNPY